MMIRLPDHAARPMTFRAPPFIRLFAGVFMGSAASVTLCGYGSSSAWAQDQVTAAQTTANTEWRPANEPYRLVRTLQSIQDRTAHGSREALTLQSPLLSQIEQQLLAAPDYIWQDPRNARAAVSFVLSGGSPAILRKLDTLNPPPAIQTEILKGVLAYIEGKEDQAKSYLENINPRHLPSGINGRIALVQSALYARTEPERAMASLDLSRLLLPGTLVDEGALRRQVFLAGQLGLNQRFKTLAKHYLQRYPDSVYAGDFHQRFSAALIRLELTGTLEEEKWLYDMLAELDVPSQVNINLILAKQAIEQGKTRMAMLGAKHAMDLAPKGTMAAERAKLYYAAATVTNADDFVSSKAMLQNLNRRLLPADDIKLLETATYIATRIRQMPVETSIAQADVTPPSSEITSNRANTVPGFESAPALGATVSRVQDLLSKSDRIIDEDLGT